MGPIILTPAVHSLPYEQQVEILVECDDVESIEDKGDLFRVVKISIEYAPGVMCSPSDCNFYVCLDDIDIDALCTDLVMDDQIVDFVLGPNNQKAYIVE